MLRHLVRADQLTIPVLTELFELTDDVRRKFENPHERKQLRARLAGDLMHAIFFEKSVLTRFCFESAAYHLGMNVSWTELTEEVKWETADDFLRSFAGNSPDVIVLRHPQDGFAEHAQAIVDAYGYPCHIINAGDGQKHHPTQALVDAYTMYQRFGGINGLTVIIGGNLSNGRTVRSLVYLLSMYRDVRFIFVSPMKLGIGSDTIEHLLELDIRFDQVQDLASVLPEADVVYWTPLELALIKDTALAQEMHELQQRDFTIRGGHLGLLKPEAIIIHALPRSGDISPQVDADPRAYYFEQAKFGMYAMMAVLSTLVRGEQR